MSIATRALGRDWAVQSAQDGELGVRIARNTRPDVIILDMFVNGQRDGFWTLRELKSNPVTTDIPLILLAKPGQAVNSLLEDGDVKGLVREAFAFLEKPVQVDRLRDVSANAFEIRTHMRPHLSTPKSDKKKPIGE